MSTYTSAYRTNYFRVRDLDAFRQTLTANGIAIDPYSLDEPHLSTTPPAAAPQGSVAIIAPNGTPWLDADYTKAEWEEEHNDDTEKPEFYEDIVYLIADHIVPGDVAIITVTGQEKMAYLTGVAFAIDHTGELITVTLDDIYDKAATAFAGATITQAWG